MKNVFSRSCVIGIIIFIFGAGALFAGTAPSLELLSPKRGAELEYGSEVIVAVSIYDAEGDADVNSIEIKVDGEDVTAQANKSAFLTTYTFSETEATGRHVFSFTIEDREGNTSTVESFFSISQKPKRERKVSANGSVRAGAEYEKEADQNTVGSVDVNMYGGLSNSINYALHVLVTNEEASDGQRVSRYRLDLLSPFGGLVVGDTTPSFTDYSIDGQEVFGVHASPQIGFIGVEAVYGKSLKAIEYPDEPETYKQSVYGGKLKIGSVKRLQWGLAFLKVKDDPASIDLNPVDPAQTPLPKDNIVLGTNLKLSVAKGKITIYGEANESLLNEDISAGPSDFEDFDLPFKPADWEWLFTINEHIVPVMPGMTSLAAKGSIKIGPFYDNTLNAEYSYVGPSYYSLINKSIINDRAGFRIYDNIWLLSRSIFLNAGYQKYKNNLEDTLTYTNTNTGYSGGAYVYPTDYLSFNAGLDRFKVKNDAPAGNVLAVETLNTTITGGVSQGGLEVYKTTSTAFFNTSASLYKDEITSANDSKNYSTRLGAISYFDDMPLDTKAVVGLDFGDSPNSIYLQGKGGYRFLSDETLYGYTKLIYETGPEEFDFTVGAEWEGPWEVLFEGEFEYITSPALDDVLLSVFATKEF